MPYLLQVRKAFYTVGILCLNGQLKEKNDKETYARSKKDTDINADIKTN